MEHHPQLLVLTRTTKCLNKNARRKICIPMPVPPSLSSAPWMSASILAMACQGNSIFSRRMVPSHNSSRPTCLLMPTLIRFCLSSNKQLGLKCLALFNIQTTCIQGQLLLLLNRLKWGMQWACITRGMASISITSSRCQAVGR